MAGPWHLRMASEHVAAAPSFSLWALICMTAGVVIGVLAVVVPMRVGAQALRKMEF
jgi:hypothetical protein